MSETYTSFRFGLSIPFWDLKKINGSWISTWSAILFHAVRESSAFSRHADGRLNRQPSGVSGTWLIGLVNGISHSWLHLLLLEDIGATLLQTRPAWVAPDHSITGQTAEGLMSPHGPPQCTMTQ